MTIKGYKGSKHRPSINSRELRRWTITFGRQILVWNSYCYWKGRIDVIYLKNAIHDVIYTGNIYINVCTWDNDLISVHVGYNIPIRLIGGQRKYLYQQSHQRIADAQTKQRYIDSFLKISMTDKWTNTVPPELFN